MDLGFRYWTEDVLIERYVQERYGGIFELVFYSDTVEMNKYLDAKREILDSTDTCLFEMDSESLAIFRIYTPRPAGFGFGTLALKRLEEMAKEKDLKQIEIVKSINPSYWGGRLGFQKARSAKTRHYKHTGGTVDFVKPLSETAIVPYSPITTSKEFTLFETMYEQRERVDFFKEKFESDVADALGIPVSVYRCMDPSEITAQMQKLILENGARI